MASAQLIQAIAATAELCGKVYTPAAARMLADDLSGYDERAVMAALSRCRKELDGKPFNVAAIISRIEDGRPGPQEAWAMMPVDESTSVVWTTEMQEAWGIAYPLMDGRGNVAARMAFLEAYAKAVTMARDRKDPPRWQMSPGTDSLGRQSALIEAVRLQRLPLDHAIALLPPEHAEGLVMSLGVTKHPLLAAPSKEGQAKVKALLSGLKSLTAPRE